MESTVAQKLEALIRLQTLDSKLDDINKMRGDLPEEVRDLEDEIEGYDTRLGKFNAEIEGFESEIAEQKNAIKDAEKLIKKYEEQQNNIRNSREYDAITKEVESQSLDIQLHDKRIREAQFRIEKKKEEIEAIKGVMAERRKDLDTKRTELEHLLEESKDDEAKLAVEREAASKDVDERLLFSYNRLRSNARNGLSVVAVKRSACGGCFNQVPPQRQADIRERKKIIVCEHCGRILASVESGELEAAQAIAAAAEAKAAAKLAK